ncbi:oligosaccharide flippase family protein [Marinivivus vitaminiproducens]|uniref:oligosaccharide flippase family protein n=1 Tax=Marinivivus vitaminiproducens TaxID=3035935 RepID=UPI0027A8AA17|nr:oligosaccharide flippase family protein [Geminicoccaceae bacterium SCSIO 64248]
MGTRSAGAELLAGFGVTVAGRIAGRGAQVAMQAILARLLGVDVFGLYTIAWSAVRLLGSVGALGVPRALVRHGCRLGEDGPAWRPAGWLLLALGIAAAAACGALFWLGRSLLGQTVFGRPELADAFGGLAPAAAALAVLGVLGGLARALGRHGLAVLVQDALQPWLGLVLVLAFAGTGLGLGTALDLISLSCLLAVLAGGAVVAPWVVRLPRTGEPWSAGAPAALKFAGVTALTGSFASVTLWTDRLMLGALQPAAEAGLYQAAVQIAMLFTILGASVANASEPGAVRRETAGATYRTGVRGAWHVALPSAVFLILEAQALLGAIYGEPYAAADTCLVLLTLGGLIGVAAGPASAALVMGGRAKVWLLVVVAGAIGNVGLNLLLIPWLGAEGAALATALAQVPALAVGLAAVARVYGFRPRLEGVLKPVLAALAAGCAGAVLDPGPDTTGLLRLAPVAAAVFTAYGAALLGLGLEADESRFVGRLLTRLKPNPA